jgi:hypothetical protein
MQNFWPKFFFFFLNERLLTRLNSATIGARLTNIKLSATIALRERGRGREKEREMGGEERERERERERVKEGGRERCRRMRAQSVQTLIQNTCFKSLTVYRGSQRRRFRRGEGWGWARRVSHKRKWSLFCVCATQLVQFRGKYNAQHSAGLIKKHWRSLLQVMKGPNDSFGSYANE